MLIRLKLQLNFILISLVNLILGFPAACVRHAVLRLIGVELGRGSIIHRGVKIKSVVGPLRVGARSIIGPRCIIDNRRGVFIGCDVNISAGCHLATLGHSTITDRNKTVGFPISINDKVFIFSEAFVCPGVTIGYGSVVSARAVVTKNLGDWVLVAGNPAIVKKNIEPFDYELSPYKYWWAL